jgi:hypothetical protein
MSSTSEELAASSEELAAQAESMRAAMAFFKVGAEGEGVSGGGARRAAKPARGVKRMTAREEALPARQAPRKASDTNQEHPAAGAPIEMGEGEKEITPDDEDFVKY